jgi:hypothetical protein
MCDSVQTSPSRLGAGARQLGRRSPRGQSTRSPTTGSRCAMPTRPLGRIPFAPKGSRWPYARRCSGRYPVQKLTPAAALADWSAALADSWPLGQPRIIRADGQCSQSRCRPTPRRALRADAPGTAPRGGRQDALVGPRPRDRRTAHLPGLLPRADAKPGLASPHDSTTAFR